MFGLFNDVEFCYFEVITDPTTQVKSLYYPPELPNGGNPCEPKYNYFIVIVGVVDTIITYLVEAVFIRKFTVRYDEKHEAKKLADFAASMEALIPKQIDSGMSSDSGSQRY